MDSSFDYSLDGIENKAAFFDKNYTVFVEGPEDILFWDSLFERAGITDLHIEDVGGCKNLEPYIQKIQNEDINILVACDSDYCIINNSKVNHKKIIYTHGFSIENSMYRTEKINEIAQYLAKKRIDEKETIRSWKLDFETKLDTLLIYDYANQKFEKGLTVLGLNSCRYLIDKSSRLLCETKINSAITKLKENFSDEEYEASEIEIRNSSLRNWFKIRGHFLSNAVYNLIKYLAESNSGNSISFSLDSLYAMSVNCSNYHTEDDIKPLIDNIIEADKVVRNK